MSEESIKQEWLLEFGDDSHVSLHCYTLAYNAGHSTGIAWAERATAEICADIAKTWANKTTDNVNRSRYLEIEKAIKKKFRLEI